MSTTIDNLGTWFHVGTIPNITQEWQLCNEGAINGKLFRLTYLADWNTFNSVNGFLSNGLLRFYFRDGNGQFNLVSGSERIYPKPQQELREIVVPEQLQSSTYVIRIPGIKLGKIYKRPFPSEPVVLPWGLKIEYLLG